MSINSLEREFESAVSRITDSNIQNLIQRVGIQFVGELKRMDKELKELKAQIEEMKGQ